jgi:hypothetical protein
VWREVKVLLSLISSAANQSIFVSSGQLLTHLCSNQGFKAVPNPPATIQASIDNEIRAYQTVLDEIDVEIQLSRRYILRAIEERRLQTLKKQKADLENKSKGEAADSKPGNDAENGSKLEISDNIDDLIDSNMIFDDLFESKDDEAASNGGGEQPDSDSKMREGLGDGEVVNQDLGDFNGDQFGTLDEFEDLSALLGEANEDNKSRSKNNNGLDDEDMGGLFGDNFDFILPGT